MARSSTMASSFSNAGAITPSLADQPHHHYHHHHHHPDFSATSIDTMLQPESSSTIKTPADLNVFVDDLLQQMQNRFATMGDSIMGRMDAMGRRMDDLERNINALVDQAGVETPSLSNSVSVSPPSATANAANTAATTTPRRPPALSSSAVAAAAASPAGSHKQGSALTTMLTSGSATGTPKGSASPTPSVDSYVEI